jgi:Ca-activated chloride channel family protein
MAVLQVLRPRDRKRTITLLATVAVALVALFWARSARAEGAMYLANDPPADRRVFPLTKTEVKAEVSGPMISTWVTQRFENPYKERIEVVYVFPLPNRAAVDEMEMHIGTRVVRGDVRRRAEAQAAYDSAARTGRRAALLEQERPNVFTFSVANVDPGSAIEVKLHYFEMAKYDAGTYEMVFPMVVGPRYVPGTPLPGAPSGTGTKRDTDRVTDASRISPAYAPPGTRTGNVVGLTVHLSAGAVIETMETPAHDVDVRRSSTEATITLKNKAEIPNRDFILRWRMSAPEAKPALFVYKDGAEGDGYVGLLLEPKHDVPTGEIVPRELFFLLDTSGSMHGAPLATVKQAIAFALDRMQPGDTFNLIDFADSASTFSPQPLAATPENVTRAKGYLQNLRASGGTNQLVGIHAALAAPGDPKRLRYVMFMTDGYIGNEHEVIALTQREIGRSRIFGFGVGSSVNRYLLDEVSHVGRGAAEYMRPHEPPEEIVDRFYRRIGKPYLTDVSIDWGGLAVDETYPRTMRDLSAFEPIVLHARYTRPGKGVVTVRGKLAGKPYEQKLDVELPAASRDNVAVGRTWAREKIAELSREGPRGADRNRNEREITRVALAHHLVSQYTSLVAIDEAAPATPQNRFPQLVNQPSEVPEGVDVRSAGGQYAGVPTPPVSIDAPTGEVHHPSPPPPEPRSAGGRGSEIETADLRAAPGRGGGCAGCTTASRTSGPTGPLAALGALALALALAARRRSRRG